MTYFKLVGINTMETRPSGEMMFMKKSIVKMNFSHILNENSSLKPSQFHVIRNSYRSGFLPEVITSLCTSIHNF